MSPPVTLQAAIAALNAWLRARGIDPDAPLPETDPTDRAEQARLALDYADAHIPARYADAVADDGAIAAWADQIIAGTLADSADHVIAAVRKGPSLLIVGPTGVGKTHQAYGALRRIAAAGVRAKWVAVSAADLYARLRPRHGVDAEAEFRLFADAPLLLVDDLGAAKYSEWVEEVTGRLVNWRYERLFPTIITSNVPPKELGEALGERVASRLAEMTDRVTLTGHDRRRSR